MLTSLHACMRTVHLQCMKHVHKIVIRREHLYCGLCNSIRPSGASSQNVAAWSHLLDINLASTTGDWRRLKWWLNVTDCTRESDNRSGTLTQVLIGVRRGLLVDKSVAKKSRFSDYAYRQDRHRYATQWLEFDRRVCTRRGTLSIF